MWLCFENLCECRAASQTLLALPSPFLSQDPILNIHDLTQIHSDMNLPVPDPILLTNSHDGLDGVRLLARNSIKLEWFLVGFGWTWKPALKWGADSCYFRILPHLHLLMMSAQCMNNVSHLCLFQPNMKKRKLEDCEETFQGKLSRLSCFLQGASVN